MDMVVITMVVMILIRPIQPGAGVVGFQLVGV